MFKFKESVIFTGKKEVVSKKGNEYTVFNYLNEEGEIFSTLAKCDLPADIKQLDEVQVEFEVIPGRYIQLNTLDIKKAY